MLCPSWKPRVLHPALQASSSQGAEGACSRPLPARPRPRGHLISLKLRPWNCLRGPAPRRRAAWEEAAELGSTRRRGAAWKTLRWRARPYTSQGPVTSSDPTEAGCGHRWKTVLRLGSQLPPVRLRPSLVLFRPTLRFASHHSFDTPSPSLLAPPGPPSL